MLFRSILSVNGIKTSALPINKEATVTKIPGIESEWYLLIENNDLHLMSQESINEILDNLDYDKYLSRLRNSFEENWFNLTPEHEQALAEAKKESKQKKPVSLTDMIPDNDPTEPTTDTTEKPQVIHLFDSAGQPTMAPVSEESQTADTADTADTSDDVSPDMQNAEIGPVNDSITEDAAPGGFANVPIPEFIQLKQTLISNINISNAEHVLCMNGIREIDAHTVLTKVIKALTNTDIN